MLHAGYISRSYSDHLAVPIVASDSLCKDKIWFFTENAFFIARIHQRFEVICLRMLIGAVPTDIAVKGLAVT